MKFSPTLFFACLLIGCSTTTKEDTATDTTKVETITLVDSTTVMPFSPGYTSEPETIQNFYGYQSYTLTEDERESKIWDILGPLIKQYDTTEFNTISKNYTIPGTEETEYGTQNTSTTVTVTLYYDDAQKLKAVLRDYNYEEGDSFKKTRSLYLFDEDLIAVYEDEDKAVDIAIQNYTRGIANACPDCGVTISSGSGSEPQVSGSLSAKDFVLLAKAARDEERLLEYAPYDSFQPFGDDYTYETVEPMSQDADYDVFYTANKGYYEKFMKPKLNR